MGQRGRCLGDRRPQPARRTTGVEFRLDRLANIHVPLGKVSFEDAKLRENMATFIEAVNAARPKEAKGQYIRSATLTTTMGPGIHLDLAQTLAMRTT